MIVHKLLFGDGAAAYLPFALARLEALEALDPKGFFSQTFIIDEAQVNVRQVGEFKYITIVMGGGFYFEFATSGFPVEHVDFTDDPSIPATVQYNAMVVGTDVTAAQGSVTVKPAIRTQKRGINGLSRVNYQHQIQLINETVGYAETNAKSRARYFYPLKVYESFSPGQSHTGLGLTDTYLRYRRFSFDTMNGPYEGFIERDVGFDAPFGYGKRFDQRQVGVVTDEADWHQASGFQVVEDDLYGAREFGIMVDGSNKFHVFPITSIGPLDPTDAFAQNIPTGHIRHASPEMPAWVYVPSEKQKDFYATDQDIHHWDATLPETEWKFTHDGTKACAVVVGRELFDFDAAYWASAADPNQGFDVTDFDRLTATMNQNSSNVFVGFAGSDFDTNRYFTAPGILEVEVAIRLTGPDPQDFTVTLTTNVIRDPNTADTCTLLAGYSWIDVPTLGISAGDLLAVDVEGYGQPVQFAPFQEFLLALQNLTQATEVFTTKAYPILAYDLRTVALALRIGIEDRHVPVSTPDRGGGAKVIDWVIDKFGVWIIHSGRHKDVLFPDTMIQDWKDELNAVAVFERRAYIQTLIQDDPRWEFVPLANPRDGWTDADIIAYREYWSYLQHYWYNETWALDDPDVFFHGTAYPTQGYLVYRTQPGGYTPPVNRVLTEFTLGLLWSPLGGESLHLMFCTNPRWGWHYYRGAIQKFMAVSLFRTFFAHPNGSYCFWDNSQIFNAQGMPNWGTDAAGASTFDAQEHMSLYMYDINLLEHCIFDRVHLEVRNAIGKSSSLETSFMDLYNLAVEAGKAANTLEAGIDTMTKEDQQGTFEKTINKTYSNITGDFVDILELKFNWNGDEWYFYEPGVWGQFLGTIPTLLFPPTQLGNLIGLTLGYSWSHTPYDSSVINFYNTPIFVDSQSPNSLPIRFANPLIVQG